MGASLPTDKDALDFYPPMLELAERAPSRYGRALLWFIIGFLGVAFVWAALGRIEIVASAEGKIIPGGRSKVIQPLEAGVIKRLLVMEGQKVVAGDVLIEIDPTLPEAALVQTKDAWLVASLEAERQRAFFKAIQEGQRTALLQRSSMYPAERIAREEQRLKAEISDFFAKKEALLAERRRRIAEFETVNAQIAKLKATLPLVQARASDLKRLRQEGYVSEHGMLERDQVRIETERDLAIQQQRLLEIEEAVRETDAKVNALKAEARMQAKSALSDAENKALQLQAEVSKAERVQELRRLIAPISGTVQQLSVNTQGGVVTPAQVLMVIAPEAPAIEIEAQLPNKDVGFVSPGQEVTVKVDTYPFTRFGTVLGNVKSVSQDAVVGQEGVAHFLVRVGILDQDKRDNRLRNKLLPGMTIRAEIKTGTRSIISYLLEPARASVDEAFRER